MLDPRAAVLPDLTGQVALVTGAARGQGRSHGVALAEAGGAVAALDVCRDLAVPRDPLVPALLWLLSDSARHITGHSLAVDGGHLTH